MRVVLVRTTHPGNIGARGARDEDDGARAARARRAAPLSRIRRPTAMATGADDLLARAQVCATLDEALAGHDARHRAHRAPPRALAARARRARGGGARRGRGRGRWRGRVRVRHRDVGARERRGAAAASGSRTSRPVRNYSSLNLAAAVQVDGVRGASRARSGRQPSPNDRFDAATFEEIEGFYAHLERNLVAERLSRPARARGG